METDGVKRVLLCLRYGIGDLVMETPLIRALRAALPSAWIVALGARPATELLEADPCIDELLCVQDWGLTHWADPGTPAQRERVRRWLVRHRFDLVIDPLHAVLGVRNAILQERPAMRETDQAAQQEVLTSGGSGLQAIRQGARVGWGIDVPNDDAPEIVLQPDDFDFARRFLATASARQRPRVAISPVASSDAKRWPVERFAALADELAETCGGRVPVLLGPQDHVGDEMASHMDRPEAVVRIGAIHLRRIGALLACCDGLVCNDTGLMHLAAAVGTPVVAIFGPTAPRLYLPPGALAVGGEDPYCPCRLTARFGPSSCVASGACQQGEPGCIARAGLGDVRRALQSCLADQTARSRQVG